MFRNGTVIFKVSHCGNMKLAQIASWFSHQRKTTPQRPLFVSISHCMAVFTASPCGNMKLAQIAFRPLHCSSYSLSHITTLLFPLFLFLRDFVSKLSFLDIKRSSTPLYTSTLHVAIHTPYWDFKYKLRRYFCYEESD